MLIQFHPNYKKILEVVLWVLNRCPKTDLYKLMKILFKADVYSINTYGRPVTGDTYLAMEYGTVPRLIYHDLIKKDPLLLEALELEEFPFTLEHNSLIPHRNSDMSYLSETDVESLEQGIEDYGHLAFNDIKRKNHRVKAWQQAWKKNPNSPIDWYDLIKNKKLRIDLQENAEYLVF